MKNIFLNKITLLILTLYCLSSCTEQYALQTNTFEEALVVEATITNELKKQQIKITKTYKFEQNGPTIVSGAQVTVDDNMGNSYTFVQNNEIYESTIPFQAASGIQYTLHITTGDGKTYSSDAETLTTVSPIQDLTATVITKDGVRGVSINAKSFDPTNSSKYYRYEYEETYKIIAPKWTSIEATAIYFSPVVDPPGEVILSPRTTEARICFTSKKSDNILLTNTSNIIEDRVNFPVRFIKTDDYIIANRYSILVKQYVQNLASQTYYRTLKELSGSSSILSQNQPGFFSGNLKSIDNPNEKIIGFFDVSSVSERRIFFNFNDILPGEQYPKYPYNCPVVTPENESEYIFRFCFGIVLDPSKPPCDGFKILNDILYKRSVFYALSGIDYTLYPIECGDCTSFSSNIKPSFWID